MHSHIDLAYELINEHLPVGYLSRVRDKVSKKLSEKELANITDAKIRNVRRRKQKPEKQPEIFQALIDISNEQKSSKKI